MITLDVLKEVLHYDPDTGDFTWMVNLGRRYVRGKIAGSRHSVSGYIYIMLDGRAYSAARLAHLWMTSKWPEHEMDHINRVTDDNRWDNLREATPSQNSAHRSQSGRPNSCGVKGVWLQRGRYRAGVRKEGKLHHLGYFDTKEEAGEVVARARQELYGEFAT